ncbi:hypothetical protein, partial [Serratia marcescens]|uniref:hypothetical protein n=1 Tax=Serratia marcescens TaxID=615 RepID=UPI00215602CB
SAVTKIVSSAAADACCAKGNNASADPSNRRLADIASAFPLAIPLFLIFIISPAYLRCVLCHPDKPRNIDERYSPVDAETPYVHDGKNPTNSIENDNEYQYDCQVL